MRLILTNSAPVSAFAATGACAVTPAASRVRVGSPAAVIPMTARQLPVTHQDQAQNPILTATPRSYTPVLETKPSVKLGGFRGVPPRRKPV